MALFDIFNIEETKSLKAKLDTEITQLENNKNKLLYEISNLSNNKNCIIEENNRLLAIKENLDTQIKNREDFYVSTELKHIDGLDGLEFESYTVSLLTKLGYAATVTQASQDNGGDVLAAKDNVQYIFQCKNYSSTVGNKAVQEVYAAKGIYKCEKAIVITNNFFTKQAQQEASALEVELWDRNYLTTLLYQTFAFDLSHIDTIQGSDTEDEEQIEYTIDPLLMEAIDTVVETRQASTSFIQRRFKVGYARAGRIIDQMEERGVISGYHESKPREVLMTKERWQQLKNS